MSALEQKVNELTYDLERCARQLRMLGDMGRYTQYQVAQSIPIAAANEGGIAGIGAGLSAGYGMAQAMGLASGSDIPDAITDMNARLDLPSGLAAMGVQSDWFDKIISGAMADHCHKTNPRIASADQYRDMLIQAL